MQAPELNTPDAWRKYYGNVRIYKDWYAKYEQIKAFIAPLTTPDSEIIDIGCGTSRLAAQLNEDGYRYVTAIDYDAPVIQFMQKAAHQTQYITQDARKMQFPDSIFDVAVSKATFDFMTENITEAAQIITEVWRILRINGCFLLLTQTPIEVFAKLLQVVVWNNVYTTQIQLNIGCLNKTGSAGVVNVFMCFK